jgi:DNA polymerase III epsilon subunit-like protein
MTFVAFDFETGGAEEVYGMHPAHTFPPIQFAAIAFDSDLRELGKINLPLRFDPEKCSKEALALLGLTDPEKLGGHQERGIERDAAVRKIKQFLRDYSSVKRTSKNGNEYHVAQLLAHNAHFDIGFLRVLFGDNFIPGTCWLGSGGCICTLHMAHCYEIVRQRRFESLRLKDVHDDLFGASFRNESYHDALFDARAAAEIGHKIIHDLRGGFW